MRNFSALGGNCCDVRGDVEAMWGISWGVIQVLIIFDLVLKQILWHFANKNTFLHVSNCLFYWEWSFQEIEG